MGGRLSRIFAVVSFMMAGGSLVQAAIAAPACTTFIDDRGKKIVVQVRQRDEPVAFVAYATDGTRRLRPAYLRWSVQAPASIIPSSAHPEEAVFWPGNFERRYTIKVTAHVNDASGSDTVCSPAELQVDATTDYVDRAAGVVGVGIGAQIALEFSQLALPFIASGTESYSGHQSVSDLRFGLKVLDPRVYLGAVRLSRSDGAGLRSFEGYGYGLFKEADLDRRTSPVISYLYLPGASATAGGARVGARVLFTEFGIAQVFGAAGNAYIETRLRTYRVLPRSAQAFVFHDTFVAVGIRL